MLDLANGPIAYFVSCALIGKALILSVIDLQVFISHFITLRDQIGRGTQVSAKVSRKIGI